MATAETAGQATGSCPPLGEHSAEGATAACRPVGLEVEEELELEDSALLHLKVSAPRAAGTPRNCGFYSTCKKSNQNCFENYNKRGDINVPAKEECALLNTQVSGTVTVQRGATLKLLGTQVSGTVTVQQGATLEAKKKSSFGALKGSGANTIQVHDATVKSIKLEGAYTIQVNDATVKSIELEGTKNSVTVDKCNIESKMSITASKIENNVLVNVFVKKNHIQGNVTISGLTVSRKFEMFYNKFSDGTVTIEKVIFPDSKSINAQGNDLSKGYFVCEKNWGFSTKDGGALDGKNCRQ